MIMKSILRKPSYNRGLHQLLGLRLRFCLRGKYSDIFNSIFQINFVDLFWPVPAAATECKPHTLYAIFSNLRTKSLKNMFYTLRKFISQIFGNRKPEIHQEKSEYEKVWDEINSSYERAKKNNRIIDFYLGRGDYLQYDREWNNHNPSVSFFGLKEYSNKYGNKAMLDSFKNDLIKILKENLTAREFNCLKTYIWIYLQKYYEEKSFEIEWRVEENIRQLIKNHVDKFSAEFPATIEYKWPSEGFEFKNILRSFEITKDRFDIDLLDIKGK